MATIHCSRVWEWQFFNTTKDFVERFCYDLPAPYVVLGEPGPDDWWYPSPSTQEDIRNYYFRTPEGFGGPEFVSAEDPYLLNGDRLGKLLSQGWMTTIDTVDYYCIRDAIEGLVTEAGGELDWLSADGLGYGGSAVYAMHVWSATGRTVEMHGHTVPIFDGDCRKTSQLYEGLIRTLRKFFPPVLPIALSLLLPMLCSGINGGATGLSAWKRRQR